MKKILIAIGGLVVLAVSVLPSLSVQVGDVALANPAGHSSTDLLRLGAVDMRLKLFPLPSGRAEARGSVDLPQRGVNYRIEPKVVPSLQGQGGASDMGGLVVPVLVSGPWDDISYRPDLEGGMTQNLQGVGNVLGDVVGSGGKSGLAPLSSGGSGAGGALTPMKLFGC